MQRRLGLAAALVHRPELLFLDEPTAGIDPILRATVWETLSELREDGRTIVLTTQYVSEAAYCDFVAVISEGRLVEWGSPEELRRRAFGGEMVDVVFADRVPWAVVDRLAGAVGAEHVESIGSRSVRITVEDAGSAIPILAAAATEAGAEVTETDQVVPEYDDVFVRIIDRHRVEEPTA
jgi:ABC-2 type transport system ATP-binding protein